MSSNSEKPLISVHNLSKVYERYEQPSDRLKQILVGNKNRRFYRDFHALSDVSFEVRRGASFAIVGKNGAGKSTLLQLITGTLQPSSGSIEVNGKLAAVLELGAGFNVEFSGRENIELYCNLLLMSPEVIKKQFDKIVAFSELEEFIDQPLKTYSSGMVARLAFSVIAHVDADILIIDEALSVGDAAFGQKCMRFLREFKKHGSIFFVSHDLSAVKSFCDTAVWLDQGKVRALGEAAKVCDAYLADVYPSEIPLTDVTATVDGTPRPAEKSARNFFPPPARATEQTSVDPGAIRIEGFRFNADSADFGNGSAEIISVRLTNIDGVPVEYCEGQSPVVVTVEVLAKSLIRSPIVGFFVKDRLGQPLFGGNTFRTYDGSCPNIEDGQSFEAAFHFQMPTLLPGDYAICAAIADGTLEVHTQLHWMHDAALFKVTQSSLDGVLVGIPLLQIELRI